MFMSLPVPKRVAGAAIVAACAAFAAQAEEFSWQLSGGALESETSDFDSWGVDAVFYVNSIDDAAMGPYALASFLNPTTRVSAGASKSDSPAPGDGPTATWAPTRRWSSRWAEPSRRARSPARAYRSARRSAFRRSSSARPMPWASKSSTYGVSVR